MDFVMRLILKHDHIDYLIASMIKLHLFLLRYFDPL